MEQTLDDSTKAIKEVQYCYMIEKDQFAQEKDELIMKNNLLKRQIQSKKESQAKRYKEKGFFEKIIGEEHNIMENELLK